MRRRWNRIRPFTFPPDRPSTTAQTMPPGAAVICFSARSATASQPIRHQCLSVSSPGWWGGFLAKWSDNAKKMAPITTTSLALVRSCKGALSMRRKCAEYRTAPSHLVSSSRGRRGRLGALRPSIALYLSHFPLLDQSARNAYTRIYCGLSLNDKSGVGINYDSDGTRRR